MAAVMPELLKDQLPIIVVGLALGALATFAILQLAKKPCDCNES